MTSDNSEYHCGGDEVLGYGQGATGRAEKCSGRIYESIIADKHSHRLE